LTALASRHALGAAHRFETAFYLSDTGDLKIKGYGDPLLLSEDVDRIAKRLAQGLADIRDVVTDDTYFADPLNVPGIGSSAEPYNAPNGALSVNFNTVAFRRIGGGYVSGEPQTPLLSMVKDRIRSTGMKSGRIPLSQAGGEPSRYAGALFVHFLREHGVRIRGGVRRGRVDERSDRPVYRHRSRHDIDAVIREMLAFSNNFMANQLLVAAGARRYGPPGDLDKGVRSVRAYAGERLGFESVRMVEGSGISRENRISARQLMAVLQAFAPLRHLLPLENGDAHKTGTLSGVRTRVGYLTTGSGSGYRYVVLFNASTRNPVEVVRLMRRELP
jgi:D-alanyl-D-alanine carboxypeptidase/D-alanyl-D-alanine-endopeptidase (penicillin-binding protein 4)